MLYGHSTAVLQCMCFVKPTMNRYLSRILSGQHRTWLLLRVILRLLQGQEQMHMVGVVEAMLHAAAEHDRLLLDSEHELLHHPDDCMFDIDLPSQLTCL